LHDAGGQGKKMTYHAGVIWFRNGGNNRFFELHMGYSQVASYHAGVIWLGGRGGPDPATTLNPKKQKQPETPKHHSTPDYVHHFFIKKNPLYSYT
jgi:hypothetical protein